MAENEIKSINGRNVCDQTARDNIPTKISQLTNDINFVTESVVDEKIYNAQLGGGSEGDNTITVEVIKDITVATEGNTTIPSTASQQEVLVEFTSESGSNNVPAFTNLIATNTTPQQVGMTSTLINQDELEYSAVGQDKCIQI